MWLPCSISAVRPALKLRKRQAGAIVSQQSARHFLLPPPPKQPRFVPPRFHRTKTLLSSSCTCGIAFRIPVADRKPRAAKSGSARMHGTVPAMTPAPGDRLVRFVGDRVQFSLAAPRADGGPKGWRALLRTILGRGAALRREIIQAHARGLPPAGAAWRDLPMRKNGGGWQIELPPAGVGYFKDKT